MATGFAGRGQQVNPAVTYSGVPNPYFGLNTIDDILQDVLGDLSTTKATEIQNVGSFRLLWSVYSVALI